MNPITPCDQLIVPVFVTYRGEYGLRADAEMFMHHALICLRWYPGDGRMHQVLVRRPNVWRCGTTNYYDPERREWKYAPDHSV